MIELLNLSTRRPLVLKLLRKSLKASKKLEDPVVKRFISKTAVFQIKQCLRNRAKEFKEVEEITKVYRLANDLADQVSKATTGHFVPHIQNALKYVTDLAYGQIVFTPRHDHFIRAKYLYKRGFFYKSMLLIPSSHLYSVSGPAPIPKEFVDHIKKYIEGKPPHIIEIYSRFLK